MKKDDYNKYMREYNLARYYKMKQEAIKILGGKCKQCGSKKKLEFDHIDPSSKKFCLTQFLRYSKEKNKKELAKCQLLCQKCHNIKTLKEKGQVPAKGTHGTLSSYRYCKCDICKRARRDYIRNYRKTHPR